MTLALKLPEDTTNAIDTTIILSRTPWYFMTLAGTRAIVQSALVARHHGASYVNSSFKVSEQATQFALSRRTSYEAILKTTDYLPNAKYTLGIDKERLPMVFRLTKFESPVRVSILWGKEFSTYIRYLNSELNNPENLSILYGIRLAKSTYTIRLLLFLLECKDLIPGWTGRLQINTNMFLDMLGVRVKYSQFGIFKRMNLINAIDEINRNTPFNLSIPKEAVKDSRKITHFYLDISLPEPI